MFWCWCLFLPLVPLVPNVLNKWMVGIHNFWLGTLLWLETRGTWLDESQRHLDDRLSSFGDGIIVSHVITGPELSVVINSLEINNNNPVETISNQNCKSKCKAITVGSVLHFLAKMANQGWTRSGKIFEWLAMYTWWLGFTYFQEWHLVCKFGNILACGTSRTSDSPSEVRMKPVTHLYFRLSGKRYLFKVAFDLSVPDQFLLICDSFLSQWG